MFRLRLTLWSDGDSLHLPKLKLEFGSAGKDQPVGLFVLNQIIDFFYNTSQVSVHNAAQVGIGTESLDVEFFDFIEKNCKQPEMLMIYEHDAITLKLVQSVRQRLQEQLPVPPRLVMNGDTKLVVPEEPIDAVEKHCKSPSARSICRDKVLNVMRRSLKSFQFE